MTGGRPLRAAEFALLSAGEAGERWIRIFGFALARFRFRTFLVYLTRFSPSVNGTRLASATSNLNLKRGGGGCCAMGASNVASGWSRISRGRDESNGREPAEAFLLEVRPTAILCRYALRYLVRDNRKWLNSALTGGLGGGG